MNSFIKLLTKTSLLKGGLKGDLDHNRVRGGIPPYGAKLHLDNDIQGDVKMYKWKLALPILAVVLFAAWYAFRPERLFINHRVNESLPAGEATASTQVVASGTFSGVLHATAGTAIVYRLGDGHRILRFTNFRTSNGPDVHVYLVAAKDAKDNATVKRADVIDMGIIKGNIGDQNYALSADLDLSKYRTISIWCKRFAVNFGAAPLRTGPVISQN